MRNTVYSNAALTVAISALLSTADGFAPSLRLPLRHRGTAFSACQPAHMLRMGLNDVPRFAGAPEDDARSIAQSASLAFRASSGAVMPDRSYVGFVDSNDGFDGGDAQMGAVGDGSLAMEVFDTREVLLGDGSGPHSSVQVSLHSGQKPILPLVHKESLTSSGSVSAPAAEDDNARVRAQQYKNWNKQQIQRSVEKGTRERLEAAASGVVYKHGSEHAQTIIPAGSDSDVFQKLECMSVHAGPVSGVFEIKGRGLLSIMLEPNSMVSEHFVARFTADSPSPFIVSEEMHAVGGRSVAGILPRRGAEKEIIVRFDPDCIMSGREKATLVVDAEDGSKWTYEIYGST